MKCAFQYPAHIQEIQQIRRDFEFLEKEWAVPRSESRQILVIIEELFSNIVRYGYVDQLEHFIDIRLEYSDSQVEIEIIDDGIAFNPLEYQGGSMADPASSDAGGMGLTLIRAFSSNIFYERNKGMNHLNIYKMIKIK